MGRTIVITSGKGGVGKTSITANLGGALAMLGQRVVIMDVDIGLNNLDVVMGIENKVVYDLLDVVEGRCRPKQALVQDSKIPSLYIMPSFHSYERTRIDGSQIKYVADNLSQLFDYVLIDCPAGIELGFHRAVGASNEAIVVVAPQISSIRDADKVLSILKSYELNSVSIIINRVRGDLVLAGDMMSVFDISSLLKVSPVGVIPDSDDMSLMSFPRGLLTGSSEMSKAFNVLADNILNGRKNIYDCTLKYRGFLGGIKKSLRRRV